MSTKISKFIRITSVDDNGVLTCVQNGQNFQIAQEDYFKQFGTTGSLEQDGDVTATPVLDVQGTVNKIRNLEDGSGVKASVSAQNGITLDHNFTVDATGAPLMLDPTALSPTLPSLIGSDTIAVEVQGSQIKFESTGAAVSTKTVIVNQASDFPEAVVGVIPLAGDTEYFITNDVTVSDRFEIGAGTVISGPDRSLVTLTYSGSGTMFTGIDKALRIKAVTCAYPSGTGFDLSNSSGNEKSDSLQLEYGGLTGANSGTLTNLSAILLRFSRVDCTANGFDIVGSLFGQVSASGTFFNTAAGIALNLNGSVVDNVQLASNFVVTASGATWLSGAASSANIASGGFGTITVNKFTGAGAMVANILPSDISWSFDANDGLEDTNISGLISLDANATNTVISTVSVPVLVAGTWVVEGESKFECSTAGRLTYKGIRPLHANIFFSCSVEPASGNDRNISIQIAKNGTAVSIKRTANADFGDPSSITTFWQSDLVTDDYIEAFVSNETNDVDILVASAIGAVND